jgi:CrcB protein
MRELLIVGAGSFFGGMARYYLSGIGSHILPALRFPFGTFCVNILGCLLIGVAAGFFGEQQVVRLLLITGVLGGFTTFSAFGLESVTLLQEGRLSIAMVYILLSVIVCLLAVWGGLSFVEMLKGK